MSTDKLLKLEEIPKEVVVEIDSSYEGRKIFYQLDGNISKTPELHKFQAKHVEVIDDNLVKVFFVRVHESSKMVTIIDVYSSILFPKS